MLLSVQFQFIIYYVGINIYARVYISFVHTNLDIFWHVYFYRFRKIPRGLRMSNAWLCQVQGLRKSAILAAVIYRDPRCHRRVRPNLQPADMRRPRARCAVCGMVDHLRGLVHGYTSSSSCPGNPRLSRLGVCDPV